LTNITKVSKENLKSIEALIELMTWNLEIPKEDKEK
tara:strand:+ start:825 stop:932 length:108 start_codon:yes stop_codon:yes gene_type:complete